jgi:hypothetical protein
MNVAEQAWKTKKKKMVKMAVDLENTKSAYLLSPSFEKNGLSNGAVLTCSHEEYIAKIIS